MYYSNGNYEAFARPRKPVGADAKSARIIGGGLAGLAAAVSLRLTGEEGHLADLAVEPKIYPAVRSWLESAPPGRGVNVT